MHRAIGRCIRGTCRKWRESECPVAAGEEVRKNQEDGKKKEFVPPKHSWEEAITLTTGLVLGYQLTHRRRRQTLFGENHPSFVSSVSDGCFARKSGAKSDQTSCPFSLSSKAFTQPIFTKNSTALSVKSAKHSTVIQSVDVTPFIQEEYISEHEFPTRLNCISDDEDDDGSIVFEQEEDVSTSSEIQLLHTEVGENALRKTSVSQSLPSDIDSSAEYGRRFGGDLLSVLGSFEFLKAETLKTARGTQTESSLKKKAKKKHNAKNNVGFAKDPSLQAIELMKKGADLGSNRALYNIGVAYDRMKESELAKDYYRKAADLGHPLATYNCAVLALNDGHLTEGYALMKTASDFGVPEAKDFLNPTDEKLTLQFRDVQVGKA